MCVSQLSSQYCWLQRSYLTRGHQSDGAKKSSFSGETTLLKTEKLYLKKHRTFNRQGQVLLQQPQQSCDNLYRLTTASFKKLSGECRGTSCPAIEGSSGILWLQTFIFLPHFQPTTIPGLLCKEACMEQTRDTFTGTSSVIYPAELMCLRARLISHSLS